MTVLAYSFTTLDSHQGQVRTFRVNSDSRTVALAAVRKSIQTINCERRKAGVTRLITMPQLVDLDAAPATRILTERVTCYG